MIGPRPSKVKIIVLALGNSLQRAAKHITWFIKVGFEMLPSTFPFSYMTTRSIYSEGFAACDLHTNTLLPSQAPVSEHLFSNWCCCFRRILGHWGVRDLITRVCSWRWALWAMVVPSSSFCSPLTPSLTLPSSTVHRIMAHHKQFSAALPGNREL